MNGHVNVIDLRERVDLWTRRRDRWRVLVNSFVLVVLGFSIGLALGWWGILSILIGGAIVNFHYRR